MMEKNSIHAGTRGAHSARTPFGHKSPTRLHASHTSPTGATRSHRKPRLPFFRRSAATARAAGPATSSRVTARSHRPLKYPLRARADPPKVLSAVTTA